MAVSKYLVLITLAFFITISLAADDINAEKLASSIDETPKGPISASSMIRSRRGGIQAKPFDIAFRGSDLDGDGFLNETEFGAFLQRINAKVNSSEFLKKVLQYWDKDQDGLISYSEAVFGNLRYETGNGLLEGNQEDENL